MRRTNLLGFLVPLAYTVLACDDPSKDACASALNAAGAPAASFCATFTQSAVTATTGLPAYAASCTNTKKISSACSCLAPAKTSTTVRLFFQNRNGILLKVDSTVY
jgi:hypothetical protein